MKFTTFLLFLKNYKKKYNDQNVKGCNSKNNYRFLR